jgi:di/tricarboxylate transporter
VITRNRSWASSIQAATASGGGSCPVETYGVRSSIPRAYGRGDSVAMDDSTITFAVLGAAVVLFVWDGLPVAIVAIAVALSLWATGVLTLDDALAGFGDPTVIFIASLFVVSEGLDASGVTTWVGRELVERAGESRTRLIVLTMLLVAVLTALINVNGAVAALVPVAVVIAVRLGRSPSQLLLPLAFGAHAGSLLALTGTPVNMIVSSAAADAGVGRFAFLEFALVGVPLLIGVIAIVVVFGDRLLPQRTPRTIAPDFSEHARTLVEQYALDHPADALLTRGTGLAEVVVPPRSVLIGDTVFPGMVTPSGDLVILAVQRQGRDLGPGESVLAEGDTLLLQGSWTALDEKLDDPKLLVVDAPELVRRQTVPLGAGAKRAIAILAGMVILLATGVVPAPVAGLVAACLLVALGVLTVEQAQRGISWTTVVLVGGMISLSTAMVETGAAETLADGLVGIVGDAGPHALLLGLFVLTAALGQLISNMATALIVIPIALSAAAEMGVSTKPVLMAVTVSAAAAFLTPVATPANLMVMGPGGYRFGDYWKLGLPMLGLFGLVAVLLVPLFWSF